MTGAVMFTHWVNKASVNLIPQWSAGQSPLPAAGLGIRRNIFCTSFAIKIGFCDQLFKIQTSIMISKSTDQAIRGRSRHIYRTSAKVTNVHRTPKSAMAMARVTITVALPLYVWSFRILQKLKSPLRSQSVIHCV